MNADQAYAELERKVRDNRILRVIQWQVKRARRKVLALPIPRNQCPGCFMAIYDGAAEQGWCCDCYPRRATYASSSTTARTT